MPFDEKTFFHPQEKVISCVFPPHNFKVLERSLMTAGSDVLLYSCWFRFACGWLTSDGCNLQVFAPTDVLMSVSLTYKEKYFLHLEIGEKSSETNEFFSALLDRFRHFDRVGRLHQSFRSPLIQTPFFEIAPIV